jgi:hypothetical protein
VRYCSDAEEAGSGPLGHVRGWVAMGRRYVGGNKLPRSTRQARHLIAIHHLQLTKIVVIVHPLQLPYIPALAVIMPTGYTRQTSCLPPTLPYSKWGDLGWVAFGCQVVSRFNYDSLLVPVSSGVNYASHRPKAV